MHDCPNIFLTVSLSQEPFTFRSGIAVSKRDALFTLRKTSAPLVSYEILIAYSPLVIPASNSLQAVWFLRQYAFYTPPSFSQYMRRELSNVFSASYNDTRSLGLHRSLFSFPEPSRYHQDGNSIHPTFALPTCRQGECPKYDSQRCCASLECMSPPIA